MSFLAILRLPRPVSPALPRRFYCHKRPLPS